MSRRAARVDTNQSEIVDFLRNPLIGFEVELTFRLGGGFGDIVVCSPRECGMVGIPIVPNLIVEIKTESAYKRTHHGLTEDEIKFRDRYHGWYMIAYDPMQIIEEYRAGLQKIVNAITIE